MWPHRRLIDLFKTEFPIVQAPMGWIARAQLASAVSNAGGLGIIVGDGQLPHPGPEQILETYYNLGVVPQAHVSLDYQFVKNPAYNRDRGPVSIFAVRFHAQF